MKWIEITKEIVKDLKAGELIKYHNGNEWIEKELTNLELESGYVSTEIPRKKMLLVHSRLTEFVYVWR